MISTGRKNNISSGTFKHGRFIKKNHEEILLFTSYKTILGGSRSVFPGHFSGLQWRFGDLQQTSTRVYGEPLWEMGQRQSMSSMSRFMPGMAQEVPCGK